MGKARENQRVEIRGQKTDYGERMVEDGGQRTEKIETKKGRSGEEVMESGTVENVGSKTA